MSLLPLIRLIEPQDIEATNLLIREVMTEFSCIGSGYSIEDPEFKNIYAAYQDSTSAFYVIERGGEILGCGGFAQLAGGDKNTCELRKMYFRPQLRGLGMGTKLLDLCIYEARNRGFEKMYLETVERMTAANYLYQKKGFQALHACKGATGHVGCDTFYEMAL